MVEALGEGGVRNVRERNHLVKLGVDGILILKLEGMDWFGLVHYRKRGRL